MSPNPHDIIEFSYFEKATRIKEIGPLYTKGLSLREIERSTGIPKSTLRKELLSAGIALRPSTRERAPLCWGNLGKRHIKPPYGFCYFEGRVVKHPKEYPHLLTIIRRWKSDQSLNSIAKWLNGKRVSSPKGKLWSFNSIDMEAVQFLAAPFAMCLLLVGIHCYLGLHVLARGVVFVDLSLAQVASFGATLALLIDPEHQSSVGYFISLGATLMAAAVFAFARKFEKQISQEALIGITYAFASAAMVLVIDRLAHGAEHLKEALVGQILWVGWPEVLQTAAIYSVVGAVHWICRAKFIRASFEYKSAHWFWDFLFYALFGVVITSSTSIAGVLLVFSFLIVPAVMSTLFFSSLRARLIFGWSAGALLSFLRMWISYRADLPVGAVLVVLFTSIPIMTVPYLLLRPVNSR